MQVAAINRLGKQEPENLYQVAPETFHGRGQRVLATDADEYALLSVRRIELEVVAA